VSSTCFEQPSVHPQQDLYMQFNLLKPTGNFTYHKV